MRSLLLFLFLVPLVAPAQNAKRFQRARLSNSERAMDHWMEREFHRVRNGQLVTSPSGGYAEHHSTHDSLVAFLRRQTGVEDAAWDKCLNKIAIWPGHSTIGMRWRNGSVARERCWIVQEGIPGTINLFGWRPKVRKNREYLKYLRAVDRPGSVEQQRQYCAEWAR